MVNPCWFLLIQVFLWFSLMAFFTFVEIFWAVLLMGFSIYTELQSDVETRISLSFSCWITSSMYLFELRVDLRCWYHSGNKHIKDLRYCSYGSFPHKLILYGFNVLYFIFQSRIPNVKINTGTANILRAITLFRLYNSDFQIFRTRLNIPF